VPVCVLLYDLCVFTGIIEAMAPVKSKTDQQLVLERPLQFDDIKIGSSICVSGACLSVIQFDDSTLTFDVVPETWAKTKLGDLKEGDQVNLERALPADGRFEGHVVQGHVEQSAEVIELSDDNVLTIRLSEGLLPFIIPKGSIAIDGVSLTVAKVDSDKCSVALIPHTREQTTLGKLKEGDHVNIETDILIRALHNEK